MTTTANQHDVTVTTRPAASAISQFGEYRHQVVCTCEWSSGVTGDVWEANAWRNNHMALTPFVFASEVENRQTIIDPRDGVARIVTGEIAGLADDRVLISFVDGTELDVWRHKPLNLVDVEELHDRALGRHEIRTWVLAESTDATLGALLERDDKLFTAELSRRAILDVLHRRALVDHIRTLTKTPITRGDARPGDILDGEFVLEVQHHGITRPMTRIRFVAGWEEWLDSSWHISVYR